MSTFDHTKLKPGDRAAYIDGGTVWSTPKFRDTTVERLTEAWIVLADGAKFRRKDGGRVGTGMHGRMVEPDGAEAARERLRLERERVSSALNLLLRDKVPADPGLYCEWLDRIANVVDRSRERVRGLGGVS